MFCWSNSITAAWTRLRVSCSFRAVSSPGFEEGFDSVVSHRYSFLTVSRRRSWSIFSTTRSWVISTSVRPFIVHFSIAETCFLHLTASFLIVCLESNALTGSIPSELNQLINAEIHFDYTTIESNNNFTNCAEFKAQQHPHTSIVLC
jgi:hypothetical protein